MGQLCARRIWLPCLLIVAFFVGCGQPSEPKSKPAAQPAQTAETKSVAHTPPSAPPAVPEPAPVTLEPALQTVVDEIMAKNNAVRSYTCVWDGSETFKMTKGPQAGQMAEIAHHEERAFKRPERLRVKSTQVKHVMAGARTFNASASLS